MPEAIISLPDGRRARLTGPSREAIMQQAQRFVAQLPGRDPASGQIDPDLGLVDAAMSNTMRGQPVRPTLADALRNIPPETSIALGLATMGSIAAGPVMPALAARAAVAPALAKLPWAARLLGAGPAMRAGVRFGPP